MIPLFDALAQHSRAVRCGSQNPDNRRSATLEGRDWVFWSDGWRGLFIPGCDALPCVEPHILRMHSPRNYGYVDAVELRAFVDADVACARCGGTHSVECLRCAGTGRTSCRLCSGRGLRRCGCPHCSGCECADCDGSGHEECRCGDGKESCDCPIPLVQINGVTVDRRLLQGGILSAASGTVEVVTAGQTDPVLLRGYDWIALVMPRRPHEGDAPRTLPLARAPRRAALPPERDHA